MVASATADPPLVASGGVDGDGAELAAGFTFGARRYSYRRASIGSVLLARRAGE